MDLQKKIFLNENEEVDQTSIESNWLLIKE